MRPRSWADPVDFGCREPFRPGADLQLTMNIRHVVVADGGPYRGGRQDRGATALLAAALGAVRVTVAMVSL